MPSLGDALETVQRLGLRPSLHYAAYQIKLKSGWLRLRTPAGLWPERAGIKPETVGSGAFPVSEMMDLRPALEGADEATRQQALSAGEDVLRGRYEVFGRQTADAGFPPDWGAFLALVSDSPEPVASDQHWSAYRLDALGGDVKLVWELSRFGWVYTLGRAYAFSGDDRFAAAFWTLLTSWRQANPPNRGPQWVSGQEVALRLMALIFAWRVFARWLNLDASRQRVLLGTIECHAKRIPPSLDYAQAQDNNHLLVEAAALYGAGLAFPGFGSAGAWCSQGRRLLERAVPRQFFDDGGYCQHSVNYARVALDALLWAAAAADHADAPLPSPVLEGLSRGCDWLVGIMIGDDGQAPNFGPNDGALILPLTGCAFHDLRPTIDAVRRLLRQPALEVGPWSELGDWLGLQRMGRDLVVGGEVTPKAEFPQAGTHVMGRGKLKAVLRCGPFDGRPGHADQLHLDVWFDGRNIAIDPGTYLYGGRPPWDNGLAGSDVHNLPVLDGLPMMRRAGQFLWLGWAQGRLIEHSSSPSGGVEVALAAHDGYAGLGLSLQRVVVRFGEGALLVIDEAFGPGRHRLDVGWNLPNAGWTADGRAMWLARSDGTCRIDLPDASAAFAMFEAGEQTVGNPQPRHPTWGWTSPSYATKVRCLRTVSSVEGETPLRLVTWFEWDTGTRGRAALSWRPPSAGNIPLSRVALDAEALEF